MVYPVHCGLRQGGAGAGAVPDLRGQARAALRALPGQAERPGSRGRRSGSR